MAIYYVGIFPPPMGGVTIKNDILYKELSKKVEIKKIDLSRIKKFDFKEIIRLIFAFINKKSTFIIGVSDRNGKRKKISKLLLKINSSSLNKSILIVMGGTFADDILADEEYKSIVKHYKRIYVEMNSMKSKLEEIGLENIELYPNARLRLESRLYTDKNTNRLRCVYFSYIHEMKGVDLILSVANIMKDVEFYFYGVIDKEYNKTFEEKINRLSNVQYLGVYKTVNDSVYKELSKYDVLLLPTKYDSEGVPGILVEAKIAGLAEVVSNKSYNSEIVMDGVDGIVLKNNTVEELYEAINKLKFDKEFLATLKSNSEKSAEIYYIDNYIEGIISNIN